MYRIHQLTFNPFAENTYLIENSQKKVVVIDPGMYGSSEENRFANYIKEQGLHVTACWLTHAHLDHIFGLRFIESVYGLTPRLHPMDKSIYDAAATVGMQYGLPMDSPPEATLDLLDGMQLQHGEGPIQVLHVPGHSPGSVAFYLSEQDLLIGGDVLFQGSIGRTDLPGGDFDTLIQSIRERFLVLSDAVVVYSGHGPITTIGQERLSNYYLI